MAETEPVRIMPSRIEIKDSLFVISNAANRVSGTGKSDIQLCIHQKYRADGSAPPAPSHQTLTPIQFTAGPRISRRQTSR